jgi:PAS domain S-box-containing protein
MHTAVRKARRTTVQVSGTLECRPPAWDHAGRPMSTPEPAAGSHDPASRTMRIDIDPAAAPVAGRRLRRRTVARPADFSARRAGRAGRNTPYDKLLESVYDGVFITDRQGTILDFNARAAEFFQRDESGLLGRPLVDLISGADDGLIATIVGNLEKNRFTLIDARCTRADGASFPAEIAVNRMDLDAEGQLCFFVRDVTQRQQTLDALEAAVERLQAHDRARMEFVSNVSHELRTPLTSMIYAVGNMLRGVVGPLPDKAVHYLERLESDCRRLLATVNDILDLRQIENRTLALSRSRQPLGPLVQASVEALRVQADAKRQRLVYEPSPRECFALCDPQKIERVVINVVGNAVKFTPDEGEVRVRVDPEPGAPDRVAVSVTDNGIGIPAGAIERVTQRYFKVGDHPEGSGLGLAISREIVELHGGTLSLESPVPGSDRGTRVRVRLPAAPPPSVLVVTASPETGEPLARLLQARGYAVRTAATGAAAVAVCTGQEADLVLLDLNLPDVSGADLLLQVRDDKRCQRLPVIVLARDTLARPTADVLQRLGVPVLAVPWREADLLNRIAAALSGRGVAPRVGG